MGATEIDRNETRACALEHLRAFLEGTGAVRFQSVGDDEERYSHLQAGLKRFTYPRLERADKGLVLRYPGPHHGLFTTALTRLVRQRLARRAQSATVRRHRGLPESTWSPIVALLAETCPPRHALGPLDARTLLVFGDTRTARLGSISVAHLYHLRGASGYRARRQQGTKTRPTGIDPEHRGRSWPLASGSPRPYLLPVSRPC